MTACNFGEASYKPGKEWMWYGGTTIHNTSLPVVHCLFGRSQRMPRRYACSPLWLTQFRNAHTTQVIEEILLSNKAALTTVCPMPSVKQTQPYTLERTSLPYHPHHSSPTMNHQHRSTKTGFATKRRVIDDDEYEYHSDNEDAEEATTSGSRRPTTRRHNKRRPPHRLTGYSRTSWYHSESSDAEEEDHWSVQDDELDDNQANVEEHTSSEEEEGDSLAKVEDGQADHADNKEDEPAKQGQSINKQASATAKRKTTTPPPSRQLYKTTKSTITPSSTRRLHRRHHHDDEKPSPIRRSQRVRVPPVAFWKNEKVRYEKLDDQVHAPVRKAVVLAHDDGGSGTTNTQKRKRLYQANLVPSSSPLSRSVARAKKVKTHPSKARHQQQPSSTIATETRPPSSSSTSVEQTSPNKPPHTTTAAVTPPAQSNKSLISVNSKRIKLQPKKTKVLRQQEESSSSSSTMKTVVPAKLVAEKSVDPAPSFVETKPAYTTTTTTETAQVWDTDCDERKEQST